MTSKAKLRMRILDLENDLRRREAYWQNERTAHKETRKWAEFLEKRIADLDLELARLTIGPLQQEPAPMTTLVMRHLYDESGAAVEPVARRERDQ